MRSALLGEEEVRGLSARVQATHGWTQQRTERVLEEYLRLMILKAAVRDVDCDKLACPSSVRALWQSHLMDTRSYAQLCELLGRGFIHHDPAEPDPPPWRNVERLLDAYEARFAESAPDDVWGFSRRGVPAAPEEQLPPSRAASASREVEAAERALANLDWARSPPREEEPQPPAPYVAYRDRSPRDRSPRDRSPRPSPSSSVSPDRQRADQRLRERWAARQSSREPLGHALGSLRGEEARWKIERQPEEVASPKTQARARALHEPGAQYDLESSRGSDSPDGPRFGRSPAVDLGVLSEPSQSMSPDRRRPAPVFVGSGARGWGSPTDLAAAARPLGSATPPIKFARDDDVESDIGKTSPVYARNAQSPGWHDPPPLRVQQEYQRAARAPQIPVPQPVEDKRDAASDLGARLRNKSPLSPSPAGKWVKVQVKSSSGETRTIRLEPHATIADVKTQLAQLASPRGGVSPKLIHNGKEVKDGTLLENCIDNESTVHYVRGLARKP